MMCKIEQKKEIKKLLENGINYLRFDQMMKIICIQNNQFRSNAWMNCMKKEDWIKHVSSNCKEKKIDEFYEIEIELIFSYLKKFYKILFPNVLEKYLTIEKSFNPYTENHFIFEKDIFETLEIS